MEQKHEGAFADISDEQLAALAVSDKSALTALMIRYDGLISAKAEAMKTAGVGADDLFQEGIMGLLDALKSFDPQKGASLKTYVNACARNRMINAISRKMPHLSLDELGDDDTAIEIENPESIILRREHEKSLFEDISQKLTAIEWSVLQLYLQGFTYSGISSKLGISSKAADNAMQRVRRKLRALLKR